MSNGGNRQDSATGSADSRVTAHGKAGFLVLVVTLAVAAAAYMLNPANRGRSVRSDRDEVGAGSHERH